MEGTFPWLVWILLAAVGVEWSWSRWTGRGAYPTGETLGTLGVAVGSRVSRLAALPFALALFEAVSTHALFALPETVGVFVLALVLTDLVYYWHHRLSHEIPVLWALHQTHHTAERINLLASARLNWLGPWVVQPVLAMPLVLLGVPPRVVVAVFALDLVFQFFLHTEAIGRLRMLEPWLNTPAAHRVHHARNPGCVDVNYGGILSVWDRLFGSWVEPDLPTEDLQYGLTSGPQGNNPLWLVFGGFVRWARGQPI